MVNSISKEKLIKYCDFAIEWGLILFAVGCAWSITLTQLGFFVGLIAWVVKMLTEEKKYYTKTPLDTAILLFIAATILSTILSINMHNSVGGMFKTVGLMLIYFFVSNNVKSLEQAKKLVLLIIFSATFESIYGIIKYWTGGGWKLEGTFSLSLTLAEILIMVISIIIPFLINFKNEGKILSKRVLMPCTILISIALVFTFARGAWLGIAVSLIILGILKSKKLILIFTIIAVIFICVASFFPTSTLGGRIRSIVEPESNFERICMWKSGIEMIKDHPLGIGLENVGQLYPLYKMPEAYYPHQGHLHNNFIQIVVERGMLGGLAFLWMIFCFYRWGVTSLKKASDEFLKSLLLGFLAAFSAFLVSGIFEYNFGDSEVIMLVWFLTAITAKSVILKSST
ncbi:MAG: O-antigen ligase family protein [Candidatus Firestonebacteria bacterium]